MPRTTKSSAAAVPTSPRAAASRGSKPAPRPAAERDAAAKSTDTTAASTKASAAAKNAGSHKTVEPEAPPVDKFLQEQHALLMTERATYLHQAESLRAEAEQLAADMEPGDIQFDEESGEGGTMNVERERDLALSAQARAAVDEIDRALAKIAAGTYGICERCGEPIKKARLKALPYAALCIECKSGGLSRR